MSSSMLKSWTILDEVSYSDKKVTSELKKIAGCVCNKLSGIKDTKQLAKNYLLGDGLESFNITKQYDFIHNFVEALNTTGVNILTNIDKDVDIYAKKAAPDQQT